MSSSPKPLDRAGIWSYVPFASTPRRRSIGGGLPRTTTNPANGRPWDPFATKPNTHGLSSGGSQPSILESVQNAWMTQSRQAKYIRTGGILAFILLLYWFMSGGSTTAQNVYTPATAPTSRCTRPHDPTKPLVQYAIMIDAGSTGSRIHVYKFNNCGPTPELESEDFKMTEPKPGGSGLSSYKTDAEGAARSLDPLMEVAMKSVPDEYKSCTPIAVKATAGLRLLGEEMSLKILEAVRTRLETQYPFAVVSREKHGVEIMKGEDEGVFAWITTNYLLGKIGGPDESPTAAVFDLGGGSTQIVFQPTFKKSPHGGMPQKMEEGDHKYLLKFGGREFELYQHSHLGYGLMSARKALHQLVLERMHKQNPDSRAWLSKPIPNSCITPGTQKKITVEMPADHELAGEHEVVMEGPVDAIPAQCRALAEAILYKDKACNLAPCSFNGVHQPPLEKTFAKEDVYIFSYFYDRTHDLGMPESFTLRELQDLTAKACGGEKTWDAFAGIEGAIESLKERPETCLDLNFMSALLHTGYEMPIDREVKIAKKIKGNELGWCLGASLPLLEKESGWECRIREVS
ncbi:hypothetical protein PV04_09686 [Phialophora macrospora]|uniref:guanosine-diphosphatase n=1 Tax=Phialophora macrospora TaxID=1851006 RepID=A0A0D2CHS6_9EURO|nr:hypothetical protein PV04_09686 [Phialophora macrospora]